eukprot:13625486-Alexandrium_andersonii.AAC.1
MPSSCQMSPASKASSKYSPSVAFIRAFDTPSARLSVSCLSSHFKICFHRAGEGGNANWCG